MPSLILARMFDKNYRLVICCVAPEFDSELTVDD
jgi:hypothetical protein